jgi:predicted DNA binding CopG/RHH family protein
MKQSRKKRIIPTFATEAQEAEWWYKNRKTLDKDFVKAARAGELKVLDRNALLRRVARSKASKVISIRLSESDLELARLQAVQKGLPYQTYIKSILHQALEQQAKAR